jgi:flagellar biosynthesis component FlhA
MKKIYFWLLIAVILIVVGMIFGAKFAGLLALIFGGNEIWKNKKEIEKAKKEAEQAEQNYEDTKKQNDKEIAEAGEDIEAENYNNADDARDGINDLLDSDS